MLIKTRTTLLDSERRILVALKRMRFATHAQLQAWTEDSYVSSTARLCRKLTDNGLLELHGELRPYVYRLSAYGASKVGGKHNKDWYSTSAIHQYLLRNEIEKQLRKELSKFIMLPRLPLLKMGLFPGIGEHCGRFDDNHMAFVLIDDYMMESKRIEHCWTRLHKANLKHYKPKEGIPAMSWRALSDQAYLYCTDEKALEKHEMYALKHKLPFQCRYIAPVWNAV